jgi:inositol hexakisphosphate/diphosphoinositol-pentakisphosphate kinase
MHSRWEKLLEDLYTEETKVYDTSKIPDIYDCAKYEAIHSLYLIQNRKEAIVEQCLIPLYESAKDLADVVIPLEYGINNEQKRAIGAQIGFPLLNHIVSDLIGCSKNSYDSPETASHYPRCNLYFTSESHLNALRNMIYLSSIPQNATVYKTLENMELNYFSHVTFQLYGRSRSEDDFHISASVASASSSFEDSPNGHLSLNKEDASFENENFFVRVLFSPGAAENPFCHTDRGTDVLPVSFACPITGKASLQELRELVEQMRQYQTALLK